MMDIDNIPNEVESQIMKFMGKSEIMTKIQEMINRNGQRLTINIDTVRQYDVNLAAQIISNPMKFIPIFEANLKEQTDEILSSSDKTKTQKNDKTNLGKNQLSYKITFEGTFGRNMVSPRGLTSELTNQYVSVQGIVTRMSIVRPKLVQSVHYAEATKQGSVKQYTDNYGVSQIVNNTQQIQGKFGDKNYNSNAVPSKDIYGNTLDFEYGLSYFRDFQTLLVQEPPERTPVGQLPRSIEVILQDDLVDKTKPGDRVQISGIFKCVTSQATSYSGLVRTYLIATSVQSITTELEVPKFSGEDLRHIKEIASRNDSFDILANSIAPGIQGHQYIKKALILQLLGGVEKNLENGTHLRGDINVMLVGDPSTAKSQFLRHMMSMAPGAINTTGRGSSGVGLTAAVVVDKDTGERNLEAGAMVLADRGVVCIDEFDKMNEADRVAIHEVMEQQTVTIAKAGIHVSLNARCSVLAAANPIYGEYLDSHTASKNIGMPDSLLSRFDLVFIVKDTSTEYKDKVVADRVIRNHMFPIDTPTLMNVFDDKIIEPEIYADDQQSSQVFEKYIESLHGKVRKDILTRSFLRKYLHYAKKAQTPILTEEAMDFISQAWTNIRVNFVNDADNNKDNATPVTVRTLETLIRLATAHAKLRLAKVINRKDAEVALEMYLTAANHETDTSVTKNNEMEVINEDEAHVKKSAIKNKMVNSAKKSRSSKMVEESNEDEESDDNNEEVSEKSANKHSPKKSVKNEPSPKSSAKKSKRGKEKLEDDVDKLFAAKPLISEGRKRFVFKVLYDLLNRRENAQVQLDDFWNVLKSHKDYAKDKISKEEYLETIIALDKDGKVMYSSKEKEITMI